MMVGRSEYGIGSHRNPTALRRGLGAIYRTKGNHSTRFQGPRCDSCPDRVKSAGLTPRPVISGLPPSTEIAKAARLLRFVQAAMTFGNSKSLRLEVERQRGRRLDLTLRI